MLSPAEENYLKAVFKLQVEKQALVSTSALAQAFGIQAPSVTDMVKKLANKKLLKYEKSKGVKLTESGSKVAIALVRKHRIWETFLVQTLGFGWEEVHELAEELEHVHSEKLTNRLDSFLGFPRVDPHGDPIPDKDGKISKSNTIPLAEALPGKSYTVVGMADDSAELLKYLNRIEIRLGTTFLYSNNEPFDGSVIIKIRNKESLGLSAQVAKALLVLEAGELVEN